MKPKLSTVFPGITDEEIKDITIEKIALSKSRRQMKITFGENTSRYQMDKASAKIKVFCRLNEVYADKIRENHTVLQKNVMVYEVEPGHEDIMNRSVADRSL